ncbi:UvrD-helicase domain-containing protein [Vogesella facilis]|uniref:UvrD-helicase domain-containing protein n=1 Tax=Vogesella facilis TaxID=1655232 RepID=A0ABV7RAR9_9NEIS
MEALNKSDIPRIWQPTPAGKLFTSAIDWVFTLEGEGFSLQAGDIKREGSVISLESLEVRPGLFWATIKMPLVELPSLLLDGIPNVAAKEMAQAVAGAIKALRHRQRVAEQLKEFGQSVQLVSRWAGKTRAACKVQLKIKGWLTHEFKRDINLSKPQGLDVLLAVPEVTAYLEKQPQALKADVDLWRHDFEDLADGINENHLTKELQESRSFFEQVEKSPLTDEQARAVVSFDNRVLLVASAGSGKTSTMVAKAGYALSKGYFAADQ